MNGWIGYHIIAGYDKPCTPSYCCQLHNITGLAMKSPCLRAARGYQSDHYIFSLTEGLSYITNIPIVIGAATGKLCSEKYNYFD